MELAKEAGCWKGKGNWLGILTLHDSGGSRIVYDVEFEVVSVRTTLFCKKQMHSTTASPTKDLDDDMSFALVRYVELATAAFGCLHHGSPWL